MTTPSSRESRGRPPTYGYGLNIHDRDGRRVFVHGGGINGFNSYLATYYADGFAVCVISNSESFNAGTVETAIARALLE